MTLLKEFAVAWGLKMEGERIPGLYGYICEYNGELWVWTHSHAPNGHELFPIESGEMKYRVCTRFLGLSKATGRTCPF
jgi:hypothetical protein